MRQTLTSPLNVLSIPYQAYQAANLPSSCRQTHHCHSSSPQQQTTHVFCKSSLFVPSLSTSISASTKPCSQASVSRTLVLHDSRPSTLLVILSQLLHGILMQTTNTVQGYVRLFPLSECTVAVVLTTYVYLGLSPCPLNSDTEPEHATGQSYCFCAAALRLPFL